MILLHSFAFNLLLKRLGNLRARRSILLSLCFYEMFDSCFNIFSTLYKNKIGGITNEIESLRTIARMKPWCAIMYNVIMTILAFDTFWQVRRNIAYHADSMNKNYIIAMVSSWITIACFLVVLASGLVANKIMTQMLTGIFSLTYCIFFFAYLPTFVYVLAKIIENKRFDRNRACTLRSSFASLDGTDRCRKDTIEVNPNMIELSIDQSKASEDRMNNNIAWSPNSSTSSKTFRSNLRDSSVIQFMFSMPSVIIVTSVIFYFIPYAILIGLMIRDGKIHYMHLHSMNEIRNNK